MEENSRCWPTSTQACSETGGFMTSWEYSDRDPHIREHPDQPRFRPMMQ